MGEPIHLLKTITRRKFRDKSLKNQLIKPDPFTAQHYMINTAMKVNTFLSSQGRTLAHAGKTLNLEAPL